MVRKSKDFAASLRFGKGQMAAFQVRATTGWLQLLHRTIIFRTSTPSSKVSHAKEPMSQKFALKCTCGATIPVEIRQAGESISCQCGVTLEIPKLRDLRQLEPVAEQTVARPRAGWSMLQGSLFVVGLCALVLSAGSAVFVWS